MQNVRDLRRQYSNTDCYYLVKHGVSSDISVSVIVQREDVYLHPGLESWT